MRQAPGWRWSAMLIAATAGSGCAYYNAMWSAENHAKDARHLEERGQQSEARSQWALAAVKAEAVVRRHPRSRWADDALVLRGEGLARSGSCEEAAIVIARAREGVTERALRERTDLAAAECAIAAGHPMQAEAAVALPLTSTNAARRSRAEYLAGEAAELRLDHAAAVEHFARSQERAALPAQARALLLAGRSREAAAVLDRLGSGPLYETERAELLAQVATAGDPADASLALDRMLDRGRLPVVDQARLLLADADRRLARGDYDVAAARYQRAALTAPDLTTEAGTALVGLQRVQIGRATGRSELAPIAAELTRLMRTQPGATTAKRWLDFVTHAMTLGETPGARIRVAEIARDSLNAPTLAGQLFLDAAAADTGSLYAPKALVAALAVLPDRRDSIAALLDTRYAASPYTRAFHGEPSVAYAAAEDSLARELGVVVARGEVTPLRARVDLPVPGPRGPWLDEPAHASLPRGQPRPVPGTRPSPPPPPARDRPALPDRP